MIRSQYAANRFNIRSAVKQTVREGILMRGTIADFQISIFDINRAYRHFHRWT